MRPEGTRLARRLLLGLLVAVSAAVAWSLRRPAPPRAEPGSSASPGQGTTVGELAFLRFREGERQVEVKAQALVGREGAASRLRGVEVSFPYEAEGRAGTATITSDECVYEPAPLRAWFKGSVRLRTSDGFELESDTLHYSAEDGRASTSDPVRFKRGRASGSAETMEYKKGEGLALRGNVRVRLEDEAGEPTDIESGLAFASRQTRLVVFDSGVVVRQAARELRSRKLQLTLTEDLGAVARAAAIDDVDLHTGGGTGLPGAVAPGGGRKRLQCRRLNVVFRAKGVLEQAIAVQRASLEVEPGPHDSETRRLSAPQLSFAFDDQGRLVSVKGRAPRNPEERARGRVVLTAEPLPGSRGAARRVESDRLVTVLDPETGAVHWAAFDGTVTFVEPGRRAWAGRAVFEEAAGLMKLAEDPRIVDEAEGSELRGRRIQIGTRSRNVTASENVRHTQARGAGGPGLMGGGEPTVLLCREFDYDTQARRARYREGALLRAGKDEVRAPTIVIEEAAGGARRLSASGGTASLLHPRPAKGASKEPSPVEVRSRDLVYEGAAGRIVYTGEVEIRQGDILTRSPEAVVTLTKDGGAIDRVLAGEPVEVVQGARRATGQRGTYTPASETMVLVGEQVVLHDIDRRLEGRVLTFEVGSDRIRVDGREEVRAEAVFKKREPPKP